MNAHPKETETLLSVLLCPTSNCSFQTEVTYSHLQPYTEYYYTAIIINDTKEGPMQEVDVIKTAMGSKCSRTH